jgi:hypothetical protein
MGRNEDSSRNRAERRLAGKKARAAGAALTAGSAALAMGAAWIGPSIESAHAAGAFTVTASTDDGSGGAGTLSAAINQANGSPGSTIDFNVPGGSISVTGDLPDITAPVTVTGPGAGSLTITGNDAHRIFYVDSASATTISGLTLSHGSASSMGGAIRSRSALTLTGDVFTANAAGIDGGAVAVEGAPLTVTNSTFTGNQASNWGGAVFVGAASSASITGSTFTGQNTAGNSGGAVSFYDIDAATVDSSTVSGNTARWGGGINDWGGDRSGGSGTLTVSNSIVSENHASRYGGGVYAFATDAVTIQNTTIDNNASVGGGAGVSLYWIYGLASVQGSTITNNHAGGAGGGVWMSETFAGFELTGSTLAENTAAQWGGGIYATSSDGSFSVTSSTIHHNTAGDGGGGVQIDDPLDALHVTVTDSTISKNEATGSGGGGWIQWGVPGATSFNNSTITGNFASEEGGGIYFYGSGGLAVNQATITANSADGSELSVNAATTTDGGIHLEPPRNAAAPGTDAASTKKDVKGEHAGHDKTGPGGTVISAHTKAHAAAVHAAAASEVSITGTILWGNQGNDLGTTAAATLSHNLLGTIGAGITVTDQGGNLTGVDPMLGPLAANGGPTQTMELLTGSPAINAGPDPVPSFTGNEFDQRGEGFARVVAGTADIGAFEVQPPPVVIQPKFTG